MGNRSSAHQRQLLIRFRQSHFFCLAITFIAHDRHTQYFFTCLNRATESMWCCGCAAIRTGRWQNIHTQLIFFFDSNEIRLRLSSKVRKFDLACCTSDRTWHQLARNDNSAVETLFTATQQHIRNWTKWKYEAKNGNIN